jgi:choline dehydrogenase
MEFDFVIVGGGSAGCVLASRLSEDSSKTVLLLEAGGSDHHPLYAIPAGFAKMTKGIGSWDWTTTPQSHLDGRVLKFTQGRVIGGGSTINAQVYTRGNAADFDRWATAEGCPGWSYDDVLPYFKKSENNIRGASPYHGSGGPQTVSNPRAALPICDAFISAGEEYGLPRNPDVNGESQLGLGLYQLTQRDGRRCSAYTGFLRPVLSRKNLIVSKHCRADKIVISNGRATGVEYDHRGTRKTATARAEVIVASGTVGSPKLLMQSGLGPGAHLQNLGIPVVRDRSSIGSNLQDHLDLFTIWECTGPHTYDAWSTPLKTIQAGLQYIFSRTGPAASNLFETGGFAPLEDGEPSPGLQFHLGLGSGIEAGVEKLENDGVTLNSAVMRPRSRGNVRLSSPEPEAPPLIDPNYWSDPRDRELAIKGLGMARAIMGMPALKPFVSREILPGAKMTSQEDLHRYACRSAKTDHHPVGTCRMGSQNDAVVDPFLRFNGLHGLRICDASIMPSIISSNTNATAIMIAERGADFIRQDNR